VLRSQPPSIQKIEWFPIDENRVRLYGIEAVLRNRNEVRTKCLATDWRARRVFRHRSAGFQ